MNAILWSEQLSLRALEWARHCSNRDQTPPFKDPFWGSLGESRWISSSANLEPERAVDLWWSERQNYDIVTDRCKPGRQCNRYKQVSFFHITFLCLNFRFFGFPSLFFDLQARYLKSRTTDS